MTDLQTAITHLAGHTLALCKGEDILTSDKRGMAPMLGWIREGRDLHGYTAADRVVGKAAAMLFVKAGVCEIYAQTLSKSGKAFLENRGITVHYGELAEHILNRDGTDICPMERTVADVDDVDTGIARMSDKLEQLRRAAQR